MGASPGDLEIGKVVMQINEIVCGGGFRSFIGIADTEMSCLVVRKRGGAGTPSAISISTIVGARDAAGGSYGRISGRALSR